MKPDALDRLFSLGDCIDVTSWPVFWRRAFIVLFPISIPLWFIAGILYIAIVLFGILIIGGVFAISDLWKEIKE